MKLSSNYMRQDKTKSLSVSIKTWSQIQIVFFTDLRSKIVNQNSPTNCGDVQGFLEAPSVSWTVSISLKYGVSADCRWWIYNPNYFGTMSLTFDEFEVINQANQSFIT